MRLTPLGKLLVFLIGLGLIAAALWRFVPPEQQFWRQWLAPSRQSPAVPAPNAPAAPRPTEPVGPRPAGNAWIDVAAGSFPAGEQGIATDLPRFRIQRTEVSNGEFRRFLDACPVGSACGPRDLPSYWEDLSYLASHLDYPVVFVSWGDAAAYCRHVLGRLPTSAEWEKAARGRDGRLFPWGESTEPGTTNILGADHGRKENAPKQIPTWSISDPRYRRDASPYGALAMGGNVSEWTATRSPDEPDLVLVAGGSWDSWELGDARTWSRVPKPPSDRSSSVGFRCASDGR